MWYQTTYTYEFEIYCRKHKLGPFEVSNKTTNIVKRFVASIINTKHNLITDNYYTSVPLADYLFKNLFGL